MPSYLHPGIYIEEIPSNVKMIESVPTSVAAFIGAAGYGPLSKPMPIINMGEFIDTFGDFLPPGTGDGESYLAHAVSQFFQNGGSRCYVIRVADGAVDSPPFDEALKSLDTVNDISLIAIPGVPEQALTGVKYCANRPKKGCIFFMDPPLSASTTSKIISWPEDSEGATASSYAVMYYPWVKAVNNGLDGDTVWFPPSGFVMGMYAHIDQTRGVWKAPAGLETALAGALELKHELTNVDQEMLNSRGVNCLRTFKDASVVIWGARTRTADPEWKYVPVRRTAIMIERSIYDGIQWAVFEPNDDRLWSALRANIGSFMSGLFRAGALQGGTTSQAYFVRCGLGDSMSQRDIDCGQVIAIVGFAPTKPAEFVIIRIQLKVDQ